MLRPLYSNAEFAEIAKTLTQVAKDDVVICKRYPPNVSDHGNDNFPMVLLGDYCLEWKNRLIWSMDDVGDGHPSVDSERPGSHP